jgi:hypothetical protein
MNIEQDSMRIKRSNTRILFWLACLSLPLCCVSVMILTPNLLFQGNFTVVNQSDEILYITPIFEAYGRGFTAVKAFSKAPYLPILTEASVRLTPNESVHIICEIDEDTSFSEIAVRNTNRDYRQMVVQKPTATLSLGTSEPNFTIRSFHELSMISPEALKVAERAEQLNLKAFGAIGLGVVPVGLFAVWLRLATSKTVKTR